MVELAVNKEINHYIDSYKWEVWNWKPDKSTMKPMQFVEVRKKPFSSKKVFKWFCELGNYRRIIHVELNGKTFRGLLDTGAPETLITKEIAALLRLRPVGTVISGVATKKEVTKQPKYELEFSLGSHMIDSNLVVIGGYDYISAYNEFDLLIGMDIISKGKIVFEPGSRVNTVKLVI